MDKSTNILKNFVSGLTEDQKISLRAFIKDKKVGKNEQK